MITKYTKKPAVACKAGKKLVKKCPLSQVVPFSSGIKNLKGVMSSYFSIF